MKYLNFLVKNFKLFISLDIIEGIRGWREKRQNRTDRRRIRWRDSWRNHKRGKIGGNYQSWSWLDTWEFNTWCAIIFLVWEKTWADCRGRWARRRRGDRDRYRKSRICSSSRTRTLAVGKIDRKRAGSAIR